MQLCNKWPKQLKKNNFHKILLLLSKQKYANMLEYFFLVNVMLVYITLLK